MLTPTWLLLGVSAFVTAGIAISCSSVARQSGQDLTLSPPAPSISRSLDRAADTGAAGQSDQPDYVATLHGEPGVVVHMSCQIDPPDDTIALIAPQAEATLSAGTVLSWRRSQHDRCNPGVAKRYHLRLCHHDGSRATCPAAKGVWIEVQIDPGYLGNGHYEITEIDFDLIAERAGVMPGDPIAWQLSYKPDESQDVFSELRTLRFGDRTAAAPASSRPLTDCTGPCPPELYLPHINSQLDDLNNTFTWSDDNVAERWVVCLRRMGEANCRPQALEVNDNGLSGLTISDYVDWGLAGREIEWQVRACGVAGTCGPYSEPRRNTVPLPPAERIIPAHRADARVPQTFAWRPVDGATFYRLVMSQANTWFAEELQGTDFELRPGDLPALFANGRASHWWVQACWVASDGTDVCSDRFLRPAGARGTSLVTFTTNPLTAGDVTFDTLKDAVKSPSCVNCHAIVSTGFAPGGDGTYGLPAVPQHNALNAGSDCSGCHASTLTDVMSYTAQPGVWRAAPEHMDFRSGPGVLKSDAALCDLVQQAAPTPGEVADHLGGHAPLLWAILKGRTPNGEYTDNAFPGTLAEWQQLVRAWAARGMPCADQ